LYAHSSGLRGGSMVLRIVILSTLFAAFTRISLSQASSFIRGADISFLQQEEAGKAVFKDSGMVKDAVQIFADHGMNWARLRIWVHPADSVNGLVRTLAMATRIKSAGMKLLLDFHYSDWWADPGKQNKPAAWSSLPFPALEDSVYQYSFDVITALKNQNTLPDMVQPGNEISCGMLWPDGYVCGDSDKPSQWSNLAALLNAGIRGTRDAAHADSIRIMIHSDRGGDSSGAIWFFDHLTAEGVPFDVIGLSYYPWWQGTLDKLACNLNALSSRYHKDLVVVETAYPWTLGWNDSESNIVGDSSQLHPGYPATPGGQNRFLYALFNTVRHAERGIGVFYWEPDWISAPGFSSGGENLALFDFNGNALPGISAFEWLTVSCPVDAGWSLISLPVDSPARAARDAYEGTESAAFSFDGIYTRQDSIQTKRGYWLKFPQPRTYLFTGMPLMDTIALNKGWNLIGMVSRPVPVDGIVQLPPSFLASGFSGYSGGYFPADTLFPGKAYWVKAISAGSLVLGR
jgi:arabinogalactan endo-1,4-beta-galactosidase